MALLRRHKYILAALALYWSGLFVLTHMPIPSLARRSGMSDKVMHVLAYLGLTVLVWLAVSPCRRVDWRRAKAWLILTVVVWYGVADEWLQGQMGRSMDRVDLAADVVGTVLGLTILSLLNFWPAMLGVVGLFVFAISNLSRIDLLVNQPYINSGFHFVGYALFALVWIQYSGRYVDRGSWGHGVRWVGWAISAPLGFLAVVKVTGALLGRPVWAVDCLTALSGMGLAVVASGLAFCLSARCRAVTPKPGSRSDPTEARAGSACVSTPDR